MRKFFYSITGIVCLVSIVLAGCETQDGGCCLPWTIGWLALASVCGFILNKGLCRKEIE